MNIIAHKITNFNQEYDFPIELTKFANGLYLHGQLQDINGFDTCSFIINQCPKKPGIYPCKVFIDRCTIIYATMYIWEVGRWNRGLIVMLGDELGNKDAKEKYEKKAIHI